MQFKQLALCTVIPLFVGCASIPPEAPELSAELGHRIEAIEKSNITLLHRFFDQKRKEVDKFIIKEWVPIFAEEFFSNEQISDAWNTIVKENAKHERLIFLLKTAPGLQERINKKRIELIQPLDDLERRIEAHIQNEYTHAKAINNSITSFLLSASEVADNRNRYLEKLGVQDEDIGNIIDKTDDAVRDLLSKGQQTEDNVAKVQDYLEKVRSIRDSISKGEK